MTMKVDQAIIIILDDNEDTLYLTYEMIKQKFPNYICHTFTDANQEFFDLAKSTDVDLFIIDIVLNQENGIKISEQLCKINSNVTFLFMSSYDYSYESVSITNCTNVFDFIKKPILMDIFINRIQVLLQASQNYKNITKKLKCTQTRLSHSLWDIFNYSHFFVMALNEKMDVMLANYFLATTLGFKTEKELIGKNWLKFVSEKDKHVIKYLYGEMTNKKITKEFINDIIIKENKIIPVRWFNTNINQGENGTFSIGVPIAGKVSKQDTEEAIRAYWRNVIQKNKTTIQALRGMLQKISQNNEIEK